MKKRKQYIVDRRFQFRFTAVVVVSTLLVLLIVSWTIYSNIWVVLLRGTQNPYFLLVKEQSDADIFLKLALLMIAITIISFFISHKFAGPLHRIRKAARAVGEGNLSSHVDLRRGDEFVDLVGDFNHMTDGLRDFISKDKQTIRDIIGILTGIRKDLSEKNLTSEEKDKILTELAELTTEVEKINSQFKI